MQQKSTLRDGTGNGVGGNGHRALMEDAAAARRDTVRLRIHTVMQIEALIGIQVRNPDLNVNMERIDTEHIIANALRLAETRRNPMPSNCAQNGNIRIGIVDAQTDDSRTIELRHETLAQIERSRELGLDVDGIIQEAISKIIERLSWFG